MYRSQQTHIWPAFAAVVLLATLTQTTDHLQMLSGLRVAVQDTLSPGRLIVAAFASPNTTAQNSVQAMSESDATSSHLEILQQQRRRLLIENAQLTNQLRQLRVTREASGRYRPLAEFDLLPARVLSHSGMPTSLMPALIDAGRAHGMTRSELVLDAKGILLDQGIQDGIVSGRPVLTGSVVVGRIERTGRWVSQLIPISDPSFSAPVRLLHLTPNGAHIGEQGMLEGTGTGCRIVGLADTASVSEGDAVVSESINGLAGPPLFYGSVVEARFRSAGEWSVNVEPTISARNLDRVVVVVPTLNKTRIAPVAQTTVERHGR